MRKRQQSVKRSDGVGSRDAIGFAPFVEAVYEYLATDPTARPLTLSVEGEWGAGKSSFMKQLGDQLRQDPRRPRNYTVAFNAWRHDKEEALWAAFAVEFVDKLSRQVPILERPWSFFRLLRLRFDLRRGWLSLLLGLGIWFSWLVVLFSAGWVAVEFRGGLPAEFWKEFLELKWLVGSGVVVTMLPFLRGLVKRLGNPLRYSLGKYVRRLDCPERIAFIEKFHQDFARVVQAYAGQNRVFVFIDDLDRCDVPKAAELMQAINLMIPDETDPHASRLYFILGMDRAKVAAGLAVKFKELLPFLAEPTAQEQANLGQAREDGILFGHAFVEKFVQLQLTLPRPKGLSGLLSDVLGVASAPADAPAEAPPASSSSSGPTVLASFGPQGPANEHRPTQTTSPERGHPDDAGAAGESVVARRKRDSLGVWTTFIEDPADAGSLGKMNAFLEMVAPVFDHNPRRVKHFINALRLRARIWLKVVQKKPGGQEGPDATLAQTAKFVAMGLRWPELLNDLQQDPALLDRVLRYCAHADKGETPSGVAEAPLTKVEQLVSPPGRWTKSRLWTLLAWPTPADEETAMEYSLQGFPVEDYLSTLPPSSPEVSGAQTRLQDREEGPERESDEGPRPGHDFTADSREKGQDLVVTLNGRVEFQLRRIPKGKFQMGSPGSEEGRDPDEGPQHEVSISRDFYMGICAVTQEQYEAVMGTIPSRFTGPTLPVEKVSWDAANRFCQRLSRKTGRTVRLPTEAEWEYACRAGSSTRFCFGDDDGRLGDHAWYFANSEGATHPVGQKTPNAWGLCDMHGNVWEWCSDWYAGSYAGADTVGPQGSASGSGRVLRGGSWYSNPQYCRSARRNRGAPGLRGLSVGFRVVVDSK